MKEKKKRDNSNKIGWCNPNDFTCVVLIACTLPLHLDPSYRCTGNHLQKQPAVLVLSVSCKFQVHFLLNLD